MLKSSDRTVEVPVIGMEEWSQVEMLETGIIQSNHKDSSKTNRVTLLRSEVMPYAKRKEPVHGCSAAC